MPQVINPQIKEDDFGQNLATGLQIYATVKGFKSNSMTTASSSPESYTDAMQRKLDAMNYEYADSFNKGRA